jgi:hypothetical protein
MVSKKHANLIKPNNPFLKGTRNFSISVSPGIGGNRFFLKALNPIRGHSFSVLKKAMTGFISVNAHELVGIF